MTKDDRRHIDLLKRMRKELNIVVTETKKAAKTGNWIRAVEASSIMEDTLEEIRGANKQRRS